MILHDLFEGKMSELDIEYQDFMNKQGKHGMSDNEFQDAYGMTRTEWAKKNKEWTWQKERQPIAPDAHLFHEGAMKDLHTELADKYRELAPKIEKYKDSYLAGQLYDALEAIAIEHGAELEFKRMLAGARNSAHMDYDTNPGGFQNWFWYLPFADDEQDIAEGAEDFEGTYSPEAIQLGKRFCEHYNITDNDDIQLAIEIIDQEIDHFKETNTPVDMKKIRSSVADAFRQVYRGMGPGPNFRKKFLEQGMAEGSQTFDKPEPYWVCINGKKWKRFETYQQARSVHDKLEKKLRAEGSNKQVSLLADDQLDEKQDACYHKVKSRYKVWPSAYASGALVQCRKKGAANWGNKSKK